MKTLGVSALSGLFGFFAFADDVAIVFAGDDRGHCCEGQVAGGDDLGRASLRHVRAAAFGGMQAGRLRSSRFGYGWERGNVPFVGAFFLLLFEEAAGEVVFVPAGLDEYDGSVGLKPRHHVVVEPVPDLVSVRLRFSLFAALDRVVDHHQLRPISRDASADTDCFNTTSFSRLPFGGGVDGAGAERIGERLVFCRNAGTLARIAARGGRCRGGTRAI